MLISCKNLFSTYYYCLRSTKQSNVVKNLMNRSTKLVTDKEDQRTELNKVFSTLRDNNYPKEFLKKVVKNERKTRLECIRKVWKYTESSHTVVKHRKKSSGF
ncbi:unnamed protein product [Schistosoma bovis]|nr:unnamed protein product [Schistosoma bovis]